MKNILKLVIINTLPYEEPNLTRKSIRISKIKKIKSLNF